MPESVHDRCAESREDYRTEQRARGKYPYEGSPRRTWEYTIEYYPERDSGSFYSEEWYEKYPDDRVFGTLAAVTAEGRVVGELLFGLNRGNLVADVRVSPEHRRRGVATAMYDAGEQIAGQRFVPDPDGHTDDAAAFWKDRLSYIEEDSMRKRSRCSRCGRKVHTAGGGYDEAREVVEILDRLEPLVDSYVDRALDVVGDWKIRDDVTPFESAVSDLRRVVEGYLNELDDPRNTWGVNTKGLKRDLDRLSQTIYDKLPDPEDRMTKSIVRIVERELDPALYKLAS